MGPSFTCDICDNSYPSSCVKIDEDYLKCMSVFLALNALKRVSPHFPAMLLKNI